MNFEQNVNKLVDFYNSNILVRESVMDDEREAKIDRMADENGGSRQVRRRYKRELLKRIQYALWAAQLKHKVRTFPEGRYVPYRAPWSKYMPHIGAKEIARYS